MTYPLEKILSISYKDYCENQDADMHDYELKGIYAYRNEMIKDSHVFRPIDDLAAKVPEDAEAVVEYRVTPLTDNSLRYCYEVSGIAVFPSKEKGNPLTD